MNYIVFKLFILHFWTTLSTIYLLRFFVFLMLFSNKCLKHSQNSHFYFHIKSQVDSGYTFGEFCRQLVALNCIWEMRKGGGLQMHATLFRFVFVPFISQWWNHDALCCVGLASQTIQLKHFEVGAFMWKEKVVNVLCAMWMFLTAGRRRELIRK